ncbi:MAG: NAD-dependent epimerase/dehydratase family protein [Saprospiraceae bacterium]|nr:NAD-dependent epimerase/dehydratase family protein [Saprospiraceae bacterium]
MKKSNKKILVTGGAGYIGSVLIRQLLEKSYKVRVLDILNFGGDSLVELLNNPDFEFQKGDIRIKEDIERALNGVDAVVNLAAIVGDPACAKEPEIAKETNFEASKSLYDLASKNGVQRFIFASTCSNYGKMADSTKYITEESELAPISLYAETKVATEKYLLTQDHRNTCKPICLRFSTVYGLSPRMRFDLTVNEFTKELALGRELVVFGEKFWRPYCHVVDLAKSVITVLEAQQEKVEFDVFNVGDTNENYQKKMIVEEIRMQLPDSKIKYVSKNEDPRDYRVSFEKIKNKLNFKITKTVTDGIAQVIKVVQDGILNNPNDTKYRNS